MADTIRSLMTREPRTVDTATTVVEAARIMRDENVGLVPIVESDRLLGMITDRDIAVRVVAAGKSPDTTRVVDAASRELVTVDPDHDFDEALRLMATHRVRRLPVVDEDGKLVGIVAQADVAKHAQESETGEVVEKISK
jgi:CBS domain-containing protein